jgi:hypothetical protein
MQSFNSEQFQPNNLESIYASCEKEKAAAFLFDKGHVEKAVELMEEVVAEKQAWAEALYAEAVEADLTLQQPFNLSSVISSRLRLAHYLFVKGEFIEAMGYFDMSLSQVRQGYIDSSDLGLQGYKHQDEEVQERLELLLPDLLSFEQAYLERNHIARLECEVLAMQALYELAETERCLRDYQNLQDRLMMNAPHRLDLQLLLKVNLAACLIDDELGLEAVDCLQKAGQLLNDLKAMLSSPSNLAIQDANRLGQINLDALACQIFYLSGSANLLLENIEQAKVDFEAGIKLAEALSQDSTLSPAQIEAASQMADLHAQHDSSAITREQEIYLFYFLLNLQGLSEVAAAEEDELSEREYLAAFEDIIVATSCLLAPSFQKRCMIDACLSIAFGLIEIDASSAQELAYSAMNSSLNICEAAYSSSVIYHVGICRIVSEISDESGNLDSAEYFLQQAIKLLKELGCPEDSEQLRELKSKLDILTLQLDAEADLEPFSYEDFEGSTDLYSESN